MSGPDPRCCPRCGTRGPVAATRPRGTLAAVHRTRACAACQTRWCTYELGEDEFRSWRGVRHLLRRLRGVLRAADRWLA